MKSRRIVLLASASAYTQSALGLAISVFLARSLGAGQYGVLAYALALNAIVNGLVMFGADRTLVRDLVQRNDQGAVMSASIILRGLAAVVSIIAVSAWLALGDFRQDKIAVILLTLLWGTMFALQPRSWFDRHYKIHVHACLALLDRCAYAGLLLLWWAWQSRSAPGIVAVAVCMVLARLPLLVVQWRYAARELGFQWRHRPGLAGSLARDNVLVVAATVANLAMSHFNQLVLDRHAGAAALAAYAIAFQVVALVRLLQQQLVRYYSPAIARATMAECAMPRMRAQMLRQSMTIIFLSSLVIVPVVAAMPVVWPRLLGPGYQIDLVTVTLLGLWSVLLGGGLVINRYLIGQHKHRGYFVAALAGGAVAIVLGLYLVPRHGAAGVAASLLLAHLASMVMQIAMVMVGNTRVAAPQSIGRAEVSP